MSPSHICALVLASKNFFTVAINNTVASHCVTVYDTMTILIMTLLIITILIQTLLIITILKALNMGDITFNDFTH